jgi:hypothetical protein
MRIKVSLWLVALVAFAVALAGCGGGGSDTGDVSPARVEKIAGGGERVVLSEDAAKRLGIQTAAVRAAKGARDVVVPYSAVLYDPDGATWTYTSPAPRSYVRSDIEVASVNGDEAVLTKGPPVGADVVTVGAAEIWGVEYGEIEED